MGGLCSHAVWYAVLPLYVVNKVSRNTGFFPDGVLAWLVNLEAGVIIQIPAGVFYFFLSAMITHYNADRHGKFKVQLASSQSVILSFRVLGRGNST